jgi:hypothetical protein
MRKWSKRRNPNATRLIRLARLFAASVGPLVSRVGCQARICARHFLVTVQVGPPLSARGLVRWCCGWSAR